MARFYSNERSGPELRWIRAPKRTRWHDLSKRSATSNGATSFNEVTQTKVALVGAAHQAEEELLARLGKPQLAEFVKDQEVEATEQIGRAAQPSLKFTRCISRRRRPTGIR